jgi:hypothetical protein
LPARKRAHDFFVDHFEFAHGLEDARALGCGLVDLAREPGRIEVANSAVITIAPSLLEDGRP